MEITPDGGNLTLVRVSPWWNLYLSEQFNLTEMVGLPRKRFHLGESFAWVEIKKYVDISPGRRSSSTKVKILTVTCNMGESFTHMAV